MRPATGRDVAAKQRFFHRYYRPRPGPLDKFLNRPKAELLGKETIQSPIYAIASPRLIAGIAKAGGVSEEDTKVFLEQYPDPDEPREWRTP